MYLVILFDEYAKEEYMAFFEWKEEYSVGIVEIDNQHKKILDLINELFESIKDSRGDMIIKEVLDDLIQYSNYHFNLEVKLFNVFNYVRSSEHMKEHNHFIEKINTLMIGAKLNKECVPFETLDYLRDWFANHMLKVDIDYGNYLRVTVKPEVLTAFIKNVEE
jgi:hemerythrin-like metal-binding protein